MWKIPFGFGRQSAALPRLDDLNGIAFVAASSGLPRGAPNAAIATPVPGHEGES
jgi:hypothetical protein